MSNIEVDGLFAVDNCVGAGACVVNCGVHACDPNSYMLSYPHYQECAGAYCNHAWDGRPGYVPMSGYSCGSVVETYSHCIPGRAAWARLWECGPVPGQYSTGYKCGSGSRQIVACANSLLFDYLWGGNPYVGLVFAGLWV